MGFRHLLIACGLIMSPAMLHAQEEGRFTLKDVNGGFVKLDTKTGQVTECKRVRRKWECAVLDETVPKPQETNRDDEVQIKVLERENIRLKSRIAELEVSLKKKEET